MLPYTSTSLQKRHKAELEAVNSRGLQPHRSKQGPAVLLSSAQTHTSRQFILSGAQKDAEGRRGNTGTRIQFFAHHLQQQSRAQDPAASNSNPGGGFETFRRTFAAPPGTRHKVCPVESNSRLTDSQVGVDRGVTGCAGQVLVFPVRDVLVGPGVSVFLGQAKINDVD